MAKVTVVDEPLEEISKEQAFLDFPQKTVPIDLEITDEEILAFSDEIGIFATGKTIDEAKANFKASVEEDYLFLRENKDLLSTRLRKKLERLEQLF